MSARRRDFHLLTTAALALLVALTAPDVGVVALRPSFVVTLDITQSMDVVDALDTDATDQSSARMISRLELARRVLHRTLAGLPCGSRVGLAVFTDNRSYLLLAPLEVCTHLGELRTSLAALDNRMAWTGNSEVAKALHSAWATAQALPEHPAIVFITDGNEAPPLNPRFRPRFDGRPEEVAGLLLGVGGATPQPIPKHDPAGRPIGHWQRDEVAQTDLRSQMRRDAGGTEITPPAAAATVGATPGQEHLSALRETYLRRLAAEHGLGWQRLTGSATLLRLLAAPAYAKPVPVRLPLTPAALLVSFAALVLRYLPKKL